MLVFVHFYLYLARGALVILEENCRLYSVHMVDCRGFAAEARTLDKHQTHTNIHTHTHRQPLAAANLLNCSFGWFVIIIEPSFIAITYIQNRIKSNDCV